MPGPRTPAVDRPTAANDGLVVSRPTPERVASNGGRTAGWSGVDTAWLLGGLAFTLVFAARTMAPAWSPDVVQSDVFQHVFWMVRFRDDELFRDDLIADYYQSVAPPGYQAVYWIMSWTIHPILASKLLPFLLGALAATFTFLLARRLSASREPIGAFLATILFSWYVWQYDDLASATPRAFMLPLLTAQLWLIVDGRIRLATALVVLSVLLYPVAGVLGAALLGTRLLVLRGWRVRLAQERSRWIAFLTAALLVGVLLVPGQLARSEFGPPVSAADARSMPEFGPAGRETFFVEGAFRYWVVGERSGLDLRVSDLIFPRVPVLFEYAALAALLPALLLLRRKLPATAQLSGRSLILLRLLMVSFILFGLAHLLLFHLYFPSRYVKWSLPLLLAVAAGLALGILLETLASRVRLTRAGILVGGLALGLAMLVAIYPARYDGHFERDRRPALTAYLRSQPKDFLIAGPPVDTDSLPAFASRPVLTTREHALPLHLGYYGQMRQRTQDLIDGYYAESTPQVLELASRYGVDGFLVNRAAFQRDTFGQAWFSKWEPFTSAISGKLQPPRRYALLSQSRRCAAFDDGQVALVLTSCLQEEPQR